MAPSAEQQWQFAQRVDRELKDKLREKEPLFEDIEHLLHQLRIACETTIFLDFEYATLQKVERDLWDAHVAINGRYRKIVARYKTEEKKKHVVERRKWEKRYVDFLKTSQFFYKGYIQRLASHFAGLSELRKIAHRLRLGSLSAGARVQVSQEKERNILLSCHATLLRLGDLSRYRNVLRTKDRSWDVAMAYYGLANDLYPNSGGAFNQMAVISLLEGEHLNAMYHLYRALAIEEPHPMAQNNLEVEFKKIIKEWENGVQNSGSGTSGRVRMAGNFAAPLMLWFVRLHAKLYKGEDFSGHDELENEVLSQMTVLLKERSLEGILDKFVLINIAAEYFAAERLNASSRGGIPGEDQIRSYRFALRLNIRMLFMLLQILQPELAGPGDDEDLPDITGTKKESSTETITAVTRRILPALRQYSTWLVSRAEIIAGQEGNTPLNVHIKEMWSMYCSTLSLLVVAFPPENLVELEVNYLLEEDAATVGMKPLRENELCNLYTNYEGSLKPRSTDPGIELVHPNTEMLVRVRDLLRDGMILAEYKNANDEKLAPVTLVGLEFRFLEKDLPMSSGNKRPATPTPELPRAAVQSGVPDQVRFHDSRMSRPPSVTRSNSYQTMSTDMYRMVDDLVAPNAMPKTNCPQGTDETSYGMHTLTTAEIFESMEGNHRRVSRHQSSPAPFPNLPAIYNSPFSPQPGELSGSSPDRLNSVMRLSSLQLSSNKQQIAAASRLGDATSYGNVTDSWDNQLSPPHSMQRSTPQQHVGQQSQQSLGRQYNLPSSNTFSHSSSIYAGTPAHGLNCDPRYGDISYNASTTYAGATHFDLNTIPTSPIWPKGPPAWNDSEQMPRTLQKG